MVQQDIREHRLVWEKNKARGTAQHQWSFSNVGVAGLCCVVFVAFLRRGMESSALGRGKKEAAKCPPIKARTTCNTYLFVPLLAKFLLFPHHGLVPVYLCIDLVPVLRFQPCPLLVFHGSIKAQLMP